MDSLKDFLKNHKAGVAICTIAILIVVLRFVPISFGDFYSDNALNSFRAYGWLDYFGKSGQSTPFEWLGYIPFWASFSFHDAPPVAFLIQHIFFLFLGGGTVVARLPFVLSGIASIFLVYYFLKKIINENTAILASLIYCLSSYSVWAGQAVYLEGIEELFITAALLVGGFYLFKERKKKYLYIWSIMIACALLTKYTALFIIPSSLVYLFIFRKELRQNLKQILFALIIFIIIVSPVIIYNIEVYSLRGHFDAALSSMVGMHPDDFSIISNRAPSLNFGHSLYGYFVNILSSNSYPLGILAIACFIFLVLRTRKFGWKNFEGWLITNIVFMTLMFAFGGGGDRFLSITVPFVVLTIAIALPHIYSYCKNNWHKYSLITVVSLIILFEAFYAFNSNVLHYPIGTAPYFHSDNKIESLGFNQLEDYIRKNIITTLPSKNHIKTKEDTIFSNEDVAGRSVIVFDDRMLWFAQMWYFQRYFLYYRWPVISTSFLTTLDGYKIDLNEIMKVSGKPLYFVFPINDMVMDAVRVKDDKLNSLGPKLAQKFDVISKETSIIKNALGVPVFKIYKVDHL